MYHTIVQYTNNCQECQVFKTTHKQYGSLKGHLTSPAPFEIIACDIVGPYDFIMDKSSDEEPDEYRYILSIIDLFSRWVELVPLRSISALEITVAVECAWLCRFSVPSSIITDNGMQFLSTEFASLMSQYDITHTPTTTYNPRGNAVFERCHLSINNSIRLLQSPRWSQHLPLIARSKRATYHRSIGCTPAKLVLGKHLFAPSLPINKAELLSRAKQRKQEQVSSSLLQQNKYRIKHVFEPNQEVYYKKHQPLKTEPRYSGPRRILAVYPDSNTLKLDMGNYQQVVSYRFVKPFLGEAEYRIATDD